MDVYRSTHESYQLPLLLSTYMLYPPPHAWVKTIKKVFIFTQTKKGPPSFIGLGPWALTTQIRRWITSFVLSRCIENRLLQIKKMLNISWILHLILKNNPIPKGCNARWTFFSNKHDLHRKLSRNGFENIIPKWTQIRLKPPPNPSPCKNQKKI